MPPPSKPIPPASPPPPAADSIAEMPLFELRRSRGVSQIGLSQLLRMDQPNLSKLEHRDDHLVSTLDTYVAALGGRLRILVDFPDEPPIRLVSAPKPRQRRKRR